MEEANVADGEKSTESEEDGLGWIVFDDDDTDKHEEVGIFIEGDGFDDDNADNVETVLAVFTDIEVGKEDEYIMGDGLDLHEAMDDDLEGRLDDSKDYSEEASDRIYEADESHEGCDKHRDQTVK